MSRLAPLGGYVLAVEVFTAKRMNGPVWENCGADMLKWMKMEVKNSENTKIAATHFAFPRLFNMTETSFFLVSKVKIQDINNKRNISLLLEE